MHRGQGSNSMEQILGCHVLLVSRDWEQLPPLQKPQPEPAMGHSAAYSQPQSGVRGCKSGIFFAFDCRSFRKQSALTVCSCMGWDKAWSSSESEMSITRSLCGCIRLMASLWTRMTRFPARRGKVEVVEEAKRIRGKAGIRLEGWYIGGD